MSFNDSKKLTRFRAALRQQISETTQLKHLLVASTDTVARLQLEVKRLEELNQQLTDTSDGLSRQLVFLQNETQQSASNYEKRIAKLHEVVDELAKRNRKLTPVVTPVLDPVEPPALTLHSLVPEVSVEAPSVIPLQVPQEVISPPTGSEVVPQEVISPIDALREATAEAPIVVQTEATTQSVIAPPVTKNVTSSAVSESKGWFGGWW